MTNPNWGTVKEAAAHFGVTRQWIHQLMLRGQLGDCRKVPMMGAPHADSGGIWLIPKPFVLTETVNTTKGR